MTPHPLDPLTAEEIRAAAAILHREKDVGDGWRFASIELREPSKATVRDFAPGAPIDREAVVVCWNRDDGSVYKARVALGDARDGTVPSAADPGIPSRAWDPSVPLLANRPDTTQENPS